jgi:hypothetical protein
MASGRVVAQDLRFWAAAILWAAFVDAWAIDSKAIIERF